MTHVRAAALVAALAAAATLTVRAQTASVVTEFGVPVKMRDGVTLRADIYRPSQDGRYPVLLQRTPYDKNGERSIGLAGATRGYVVIIQDVRGRYTSEGEWYPFKHESDDGYDTVEWAAALPYANSKVGMFGGSYVGATQMLAAISHPPHLAGICPVVTASNYHANWTYQGGAFAQWFNQSWTSGLAQDTLARATRGRSDATKGMWELPISAFPLFNPPADGRPPEATATLAPYYLDWVAHPGYDAYWKQWSIEEHFSDIQVPMLTIAAWYDLFQDGSLRNYAGVKAHGGSDAARQGQHLRVMVGGHAGNGPKIGDVDFGPAAHVDEDAMTLAWYDYLFKEGRNEFSDARVKIFVMGTNAWRDETDWPLARAQTTTYYLHSGGRANSLRGDGTLSTTAPQAEKADSFVYDPANPAPTIGGPLCCDAVHLPPGPRDQRPVEAREDVLVYSTPAFAEDTEVTGKVTVDLYGTSSAVDTDFTAKLVDVWPNGFAQNLTDGIVRARFRNSSETAELMTPGQVYRFTVDAWSTSNVFRKGHALRLELTSSNFPRFDRNMNTGQENGRATRFVPAANTVLHDAAHPSALLVPVVR
jgi:putative CocE/NonD family hydrolase